MKINLILPAILLSLLASPARSADVSQRLTILHTNDVHGHLRPYSYPEISSLRSGSIIAGGMQASSLLGAFDLPARKDIGGIARRATIAARIRADLAKHNTPVWLVDAGDLFYYSAFSNEYHGDADVLAMNQAGYDFGGLGNHEFEITLPQLKKMIGDARFPFLCANVIETSTKKPLTKPYEIRQIGGVRVGIFGLVEPGVGRSTAARDGLTAEDPMTSR